MHGVTLRERLEHLAGNLASQWNGGREVIDQLIAAGGDAWNSPLGALAKLDDSALETEFGSDDEQINDALEGLESYLASETWYERALSRLPGLEALRNGPVAYFCSEFGLAKWLPIYSGGLGILAGDALREASDMGLPFVGVGLFYRHGYFHQKLSDAHRQTEYYDALDSASGERRTQVGPIFSYACLLPIARSGRLSGYCRSVECRCTCSTPMCPKTKTRATAR
jgi:starch phosphorylase